MTTRQGTGAEPVATSEVAAGEAERSVKHETELHCAGTWYSWSCVCGKTSRHLGPLHTTDRNAKAHERKARRTPSTEDR